MEVKCLTDEKSKEKYIGKEGVKKKYLMQLNLQMYLAKKKKGLFCVVSPHFEETQEIDFFWISLNEVEALKSIEQALGFWKKWIYPCLKNIFSGS